MKNPCLSLVYLTYRPGGIDLLVQGLRQQASVYELIVVDDYPGRAERGQAARYIEKRGIPLTYYGPSKPHSYPEHCNGLVNAMNSGVLKAKTSYVIYMHDYTWLPPGALLQWLIWLRRYTPNTIVCGVGKVHFAKEPEYNGDVSIWRTGGDLCGKHIYQQMEDWIPDQAENFYMGMPLELIHHINGFDERADCGHISWSLISMYYQAAVNQIQCMVNPRLFMHMIDHKFWKDLNPELWKAEKKERPEPPEWLPVSPNPYLFKETHVATAGPVDYQLPLVRISPHGLPMDFTKED